MRVISFLMSLIFTNIPVYVIIKVFILKAKVRFDEIEDSLLVDIDEKVLDEELL